MRISDWSSDVCSSDLQHRRPAPVEIAVDDNHAAVQHRADPAGRQVVEAQRAPRQQGAQKLCRAGIAAAEPPPALLREGIGLARREGTEKRSEEHTSELQSLMRISYAVFCLKKKK